MDKSLSIASFFTAYAGLEAFVNLVYNSFKEREGVDLPDSLFPDDVGKYLKKFIRKRFEDWKLENRVLLVTPICSLPIRSPYEVFDTASQEWKELQEIVQIRDSFQHANSENIVQKITKTGPKFGIVEDSDPANFWPVTSTSRDHRIFNYAAAKRLKDRIDWVEEKIAVALSDKISSKFFSEEVMQIIDKSGSPKAPQK